MRKGSRALVLVPGFIDDRAQQHPLPSSPPLAHPQRLPGIVMGYYSPTLLDAQPLAYLLLLCHQHTSPNFQALRRQDVYFS